MKAYETSLSELYAVYSEKFVQQKEFWQNISKEETSHAYWIETLANQLGSDKVYFNEKRFDIAPIKQCIDEVDIRIAQAKNDNLVMIEAVSISIGIENGMIERNFFEVFESDSAEIKKTFNMLRMETIKHANSMREMWDMERAKNEKTDSGFWQSLKNLFN